MNDGDGAVPWAIRVFDNDLYRLMPLGGRFTCESGFQFGGVMLLLFLFCGGKILDRKYCKSAFPMRDRVVRLAEALSQRG